MAVRGAGQDGVYEDRTLIDQLVADGELSDPASTRGRLLNCGARLFQQKGFARTTVRDIGAEVGILSGSIFHHFSSKEEILRCVMEEVIRFARARMAAAVAAEEDPRDQLRACIRCELEAVHGHSVPGFSILVLEWRSLSSESQASVLRLRDSYEQIWREVFTRLGRPLDDPALSRRLIQGAIAHTHNWFRPEGKTLSLEGLSGQILAVFAPE
ncbi:TetR/AcrR family transcriptional regulator [Microbulbifer guangxiensis]|uniref:TetR/AcrR family transcriptional regulator n=1 Tax=Microbulbifer guangxiensis TaxID=2904249 RepID=UPI001F2C4EC1